MSRVPLRATVAEIPAYVPGARPTFGAQAYKLSSNENPYPPLPSVLAAIADGAADVNRYPDMFATELSAAIAAHLGIETEQVVPANGSVSALGHVLTAVCANGDEVVVPWRSFEAYPIAVALTGATTVAVPLADDGRLDLVALAAAVTRRTRAVLVCSPNNPTGPAVHTDELTSLLENLPGHVMVVLDEAYVEFNRDPQAADGVAFLNRYPNVVLLRTFSKAYGLAGLRVGYAVARPRLAAGIRKATTPFGVSGIAQLAAVVSLESHEELMRRVEAVVQERTRMSRGLRGQGWTVTDSQANFLWLPTGGRTASFATHCATNGLLVRPFGNEGVRISIGETEATDLLLKVTGELDYRI